MEVQPADIIIVHGLHPLFTAQLRNLAHVRIYLDPEIALLQQWKIMRDSTSRGYTVAQVREQMTLRRRDRRQYIQPQKRYADIIIRFSRGSLYYRTRDLAHLDVRLFETKHAPKVDLSDVLEASHNGDRPTLRLTEQIYAGEIRDVLEIDGDISHQKARELEDRIWSHMRNASHLRPDRLNQLAFSTLAICFAKAIPLLLPNLSSSTTSSAKCMNYAQNACCSTI